jgi:hypothetical protein
MERLDVQYGQSLAGKSGGDSTTTIDFDANPYTLSLIGSKLILTNCNSRIERLNQWLEKRAQSEKMNCLPAVRDRTFTAVGASRLGRLMRCMYLN